MLVRTLCTEFLMGSTARTRTSRRMQYEKRQTADTSVRSSGHVHTYDTVYCGAPIRGGRRAWCAVFGSTIPQTEHTNQLMRRENKQTATAIVYVSVSCACHFADHMMAAFPGAPIRSRFARCLGISPLFPYYVFEKFENIHSIYLKIFRKFQNM